MPTIRMCIKYIETLLEFHATQGGSAILLSATLPQKQRQELVAGFGKGLGKSAGIDREKIRLPPCDLRETASHYLKFPLNAVNKPIEQSLLNVSVIRPL